MTLVLPKFIFLNGPAGSGKSTLARMVCAAFPGVYAESFAEPIRQMIYSVWYPDADPFMPTPNLKEQAVKDSPMPLALPGVEPFTHREEMIAFSEDYLKRRYGSRIFGKLLLRRIRDQQLFFSSFIIEDSGFRDEALEIIDQEGADVCVLIRLRREGCDFSGDSRSYISLPCREIDLSNNTTPDGLLASFTSHFGAL